MKLIGKYIGAVFFLQRPFWPSLHFLFFADGSAYRLPLCTMCGAGTMSNVTRRETITSRHPCMHGHEGYYDVMAKYYDNTYYECSACHYGTRTSSVYVGETLMYCEYT